MTVRIVRPGYTPPTLADAVRHYAKAAAAFLVVFLVCALLTVVLAWLFADLPVGLNILACGFVLARRGRFVVTDPRKGTAMTRPTIVKNRRPICPDLPWELNTYYGRHLCRSWEAALASLVALYDLGFRHTPADLAPERAQS